MGQQSTAFAEMAEASQSNSKALERIAEASHLQVSGECMPILIYENYR